MIVELIFDLIYAVLSVLTLALKMPAMPVKVVEIIATAMDYITSGLAIVSAYVDMSYLLTLFGIIAVIDFVIVAYHIIMWILRKIPILGIE